MIQLLQKTHEVTKLKYSYWPGNAELEKPSDLWQPEFKIFQMMISKLLRCASY